MLRMLTGVPADGRRSRALNAYLATVCEHGLNASTFAARVVASTRAGLVSAAMAGISALKGPLHGGAPGPVLDMLDAIGEAGKAEAWLTQALARGDRLMGFGHRIYRVRDPRADALKAALRQLGARAAREAAWRLPSRSKRPRSTSCARKSPAGRWKPMSSSTRPSCSTRSAFPPTASPASSSPAACPAGSRMHASRNRAAG